MGCKGCPERSERLKFDRYGNPIVDGEPKEKDLPSVESAMSSYEKEVYNQTMLKNRSNVTYKEYVKGKEEHRKRTRDIGNDVIKSFSDDYKRIQVDELIAVYNNEEVHRLSPTQALVMLYELVHHKDYQKIIEEFVGLNEIVDKKYKQLMDDRINVNWSPS